MASDVYKEFVWRRMIYEGTEGVADLLARENVTCYIGFDPTASSLHVGSLLPMLALARMQRFGHTPIAIAGGGTGLIGDPSGRVSERCLLSPDEIEENLKGIREQLATVLDFDAQVNPARIVNNADWLTKLDLMSFLRDIGKHFTVNYMLAKESVKSRLARKDSRGADSGDTVERPGRDGPSQVGPAAGNVNITVPSGAPRFSGQAPSVAEGISFTEFSYMLLQAYDFLSVYDRYRCTLQMGGSDQWGKITAGCDLIRKLRGGRAHGLVLPLVTTASGVKFGKTEAGTVWLDARRTSAFRFYQFWLNTDDRDVSNYLRFFTFLPRPEIEGLDEEVEQAPDARAAQRMLARDVTRLVHGEQAVARAERASGLLFGEGITELNVDEVLAVFEDVPSIEIGAADFAGSGIALADILVRTGAVASKGEAGRLIRGGGVYVNNRRIAGERTRLTVDQAIAGQLFLVRKGQRQNYLVKLIS